MKNNFRVNITLPELPESNDSELNLFDPGNPDINLFNLVDEEQIRLSGSKIEYFKYYQTDDYDDVYMESRKKPIAKDPIVIYGHYEPKALTENLTQFGIEVQNDQLFIFNRSYIERKLGRFPIPGDILKPKFQNQKYEIFEVVEDSFESYGVYHLVCTAKLLRDNDDIQDEVLLNTENNVGGFLGERE